MLSFSPSFVFALSFVLSALFPLTAAHFEFPNLKIFAEIQLPALTLHPQQDAFNFDLASALPPAESKLTPFAAPPTSCQAYLGPGKECASDMDAQVVTFEDCGDGITVCRCRDANMTLATAVDRLGRVPVGLRRFVGNVFLLGGVTHAYTNLSTGDIHLFGDAAMDTWIHEASHAFDFSVPTAPHSGSVEWEKATFQDSCAPDDYALTNRVEDFAQMSVLKIYMLLHGGNPPPGFQTACMLNQLNFMSTLAVYNATTLFGNTCRIHDGVPGVRFV
ncbi:hypothetical protein C8R43DRAFT_903477 [Mycena crocata]|nr:hypothetical protein C8R43DRAFT_903477 [Mycena crocata]